MEHKMDSKEISISKTILNTSCEQPIDANFTLPDYCPDIQKILKCCVTPKISSRKLSDNRLNIDGDLIIGILYSDSEHKQVKYCDYSLPFSHFFDISTPYDELVMPLLFTDAKTEYVNCRAVSPRKINVHGAFGLFAKILCKASQEIITNIDSDDIEQKKDTVTVSNIISQGQQNFLVSEILELAKGKPPIQSIIRTDLHISLKSYKALDNKIILKAEATLKILYISDMEKSNIDTMQYIIPISQIVDLDGLNENSEFVLDLDVLNYTCSVHSDSSGDDTLIDFEAKLSACIVSFENVDICVLVDAFSRKYETNLEYKLTSSEKIVDTITNSHTSKEIIPCEDNIEQIIDVWSDNIKSSVSKSDNNFTIIGKFNVCVLALDENAQAVYIEKTVNFEHPVNTPVSKNIKCNCKADITSISYRLTSSGDIEAKTDILFNLNICQIHSCKSVCYAFADEDKPIPKKDATVIIYYASKHESVWDIARKYSCSLQNIIDENEIEDDVISDNGVIFIPV